ncbi:uncharacterized protein LOC142802754 isoform X2 [Rhipicephalus microplus]|uniref:uncharacterized protein LOC142802754 isoform X2 n=1 Tax=Rhipicephalus microplus TaxID=6941 RepID=UPI003F6B85C2
MPRPAECFQRRGYLLSAVATTARWPLETPSVAVPPASSRWGLPCLLAGNSQALRTEESTSPVRSSFQDWKLLQKALTFQRLHKFVHGRALQALKLSDEDAKNVVLQI